MKARLENMLRNLSKSQQKKDQAGFTLIELMIVVAIIGILAEIAIPQYQSYVARSQVSEAVSIVAPAKLAVAEFVNEMGKVPDATDNISYSVTTTGAYVASVGVAAATGLITVTMKASTAGVNANIGGKTLQLTPSYTAGQGSVTWLCRTGASNGIDGAYLPSSCKP